MTSDSTSSAATSLAQRHTRFGWWMLLLFVTLGLALEALHGLKIGWYLNVTNETRRLMWTLSHAHGTLLAVINIAFGLALTSTLSQHASRLKLASASFLGATVLLPVGFLLGGVWIHGGDPGLGILLVPIGGILLILGLLTTALATLR